MGCDIHMYVEYKRNNSKDFSNFGGRINPGRNYFMFGLLSKGVRYDNENGIEPKGLPDIDTLSYESRGDARCYITENPSDEGGQCTLEQAHQWIQHGNRKIYDYNGKPKWVDHPDWHSHSWLTTSEYEGQLKKYYDHLDASKYKEPEYSAVLAAMKSLEADGYEARIVFWFDN